MDDPLKEWNMLLCCLPFDDPSDMRSTKPESVKDYDLDRRLSRHL